MMELKQFIAESIEQIAQGVIDAREKSGKYEIIVNPNIIVGRNGDYSIPSNPETFHVVRRVQKIDMDISVNVQETSEKGAKGVIGVFPFNVGGGLSSNTASTQENRIRFSIPICLPVTDISKQEDDKYKEIDY